jgi:hypothetical protein
MRIKPVFNHLPNEIEQYILELNGSIMHFQHMKSLINEIIFKGILNHLYNLPSFEWFEHISIDESITYMNLMMKCNCCEEHNINRPTLVMYIGGYVPDYSTSQFPNDRECKCKCKCRHLARNMCREMNDIVEDF